MKQCSPAVLTLVLACGDGPKQYAPKPTAPATEQRTPTKTDVPPHDAGPVEVLGSKMLLNPNDKVISPTLRNARIWEPLETKLFQHEVKEGDVVVDIGANIGYYTLLAAKIVGPKGRVYAFEPDPEAFGYLQKNVELNGYTNVVLEQKAVGALRGRLELFRADTNRGDHRIYDPGDARESVEVDVISLDLYFAGTPVEIDFIKIDTQGAECLIMDGARQVLDRNPGVSMVMEYAPPFLRALGSDPKACVGALVEQGFDLYEIREFSEKQVVKRTSLATLFERYPEGSNSFTNLYFPKRNQPVIPTPDGTSPPPAQ